MVYGPDHELGQGEGSYADGVANGGDDGEDWGAVDGEFPTGPVEE